MKIVFDRMLPFHKKRSQLFSVILVYARQVYLLKVTDVSKNGVKSYK